MVRPCGRRPGRRPTAVPGLHGARERHGSCPRPGGTWTEESGGSALLSWLSKQPGAIESGLGLSCVEMLGNKPWPNWEVLTGVNWFQVPLL